MMNRTKAEFFRLVGYYVAQGGLKSTFRDSLTLEDGIDK
jgi:hypothetical protein